MYDYERGREWGFSPDSRMADLDLAPLRSSLHIVQRAQKQIYTPTYLRIHPNAFPRTKAFGVSSAEEELIGLFLPPKKGLFFSLA